MSRFYFNHTSLAGVVVVERKVIKDHRGFFTRFFCVEEFAAIGLTKPIVQINHTLTRKVGAVRGMHFQYPPNAETKIVSCLRGEIFDVAVDLRKGSKTFLQWHGEVLSAQNQKSLVIPEGFAHGFQALSKDCELIYLHTAPYSQPAEGALHIADPLLAIAWPLPVTELSERDSAHPFVNPEFKGIDL